MKRWVLGLSALLLTICGQASLAKTGETPIAYYGQQFYVDVNNGLKEGVLRQRLFEILSSTHRLNPGSWDKIEVCDIHREHNCYVHRVHNYKSARQVLFGDIFLIANNEYYLKDVYCDLFYSKAQLGQTIGPGLIPNHRVMNTEHAWPQSRFNGRFRKTRQKSDLFILYPVSTRINSVRSNIEFAEVFQRTSSTCDAAKKGYAVQGSSQNFFEPPHAIKGDIARSLFYFAVRYQLPISITQEFYLRKWHQQDPVDATEIMKQEKVYAFQGVRNPFIDHPGLIQLISDL